jgi:filamentous hemagglutinin family protein
MNKFCFKTVFSARLGTLVAVGEHANSQGKANGAHGVASPGAKPFGLTHIMSRVLGVLTASFVLVTFAWAQPALNALPKSGRVSQGAVQFSQSAQQLQITQSSDRAAVNWQSFDIGAAAKVNVVQPSAQSVLLNRVGGTAPSQIFGQLQANGKVILVNPNGMVFGQDGSVSAAAFTASTLNISDADFMAGNERYTRDGATGAIVNRGLIQAAPGGYVALLGASVSNEGQIVAPQGNVYMAAADAVSLPASAVAMPMGSSGRIRLELTPASINAAVANQKGGTIVTGGGQVYLQAAALNQAMASVLQSGSIDTTGEQGGAVHVLADGGTIKVDGRITANSSGTDDKGQTRKGGDIVIGRDTETAVLAKATDVSGAVLESNQGFVETSGDVLSTTGTRVKAGEWLLDPTNITIAASGASGTAYASNYTAGADSVILASDINTSLNAGTSVTIATSATGASAGDINVNASIAKTGGADATLTLKAHNDIVVAANTTITSTVGKLNVVLNSDLDANSAGAIVMNSGSGITSLGGNITLGGGTGGAGAGYASGYNASTRYKGVAITGSTFSAAGGNISIKGQGNTTFANVSDMRGVDLSGAVLSTSGSGNIQIDGIGGNANISNTNVGVGLTNGTTITGSSGGTVSLTGTGGNGAYYNFGVWLSGNTVKVTSPGAISLNGTAGGSGAYGTNSGVMIQSSATVEGTGSGSVSVVGVGATTTGNDNHGVEITGSGSVKSQTGSIQITGSRVANSTTGSGIYLGSSGTVASSGNATVTLTTDSVGMESTSTLSAGTGTVTVQNRTAGTLMDVGGTSADVATGTLKLGISSAELARITAGTIVAGRRDATATGNVAINAINMGAMGNTGGSLSVLSGGNIDVNDSITKTAGTDASLSLLANNNMTVATNKTITASSGKLNVLINSDSDASGAGAIVMNTGSGITSNGGNISLGGGSAGSAASYATGNSTNPNGILLEGASLLSNGGNITLRGKSTSDSTLYDYRSNGIRLRDASGNNVINAGTGQIAMYGISASTGTDASYGIEISQYGTPTYSTQLTSSNSSSAILLDGTGSTTSSSAFRSGVYINAKGTVSASGNGGVTINATSGGSGEALALLNGSSINTSSVNASVTVSADSVSIGPTASINAGTGTVTIQNRTAGTLINVGGADVLTGSPLTLGVSNAELNRITAATTKVGRTTAGNLTVSSPITTFAETGNLHLQTNGTATVSASSAVASGAGLFIQTTGGNITNNSAISGTNVTLDNTNGTINTSTGAVTAGTANAGAAVGISIGADATATGNLNLYGFSIGGKGIDLASGKSISGGTIQATGKTSSGPYGILLNGTNSITTTGSSGDSSIKGMTTAGGMNGLLAWTGLNLTAATGTTLTLWGDGVSTGDRASRFDGGGTTNGAVTLKGTSNNATSLMLINGAVTANANSALTLSGVTAGSAQTGVYFVNSGGVSLSNGATLNITGQNTNASGAGTGVAIAGAGVTKVVGATSAGAVSIMGSTSSTSGSTGVDAASGVATDGTIDIQGTVATSSNTGVNIAGAVTSSGTATTLNVSSNYAITNSGAISVSGTTGTGASINLSSTNAGISGVGTIGSTTNKNASVTFTQAGTSTYSGAINAANFTKAGVGALTLDSWTQTTPVATNISNAYTVKDGGSLTLSPGATYAQLNPASVNVVNASTFALSQASNGRLSNTAFNFTGGLGGGTMSLGGNHISAPGSTNTFSTSGGATNTITGMFNANSATVNMNLTSATSGTTLLDGSFAALAFTQNSQGGFGLQNGGTVNVSGGGHLLIKDKVGATAFNINAGNVQVGDGTAATASATATLDVTNLSIAAGSKLTFNRAEAYSNASVITGAGSLIQAGTGVVTLTGNSNAFAGATTVSAGKTLAIGTGGSLGAAGSTLALTDATSTLSFTNTSGTSTVASTISGLGKVTENGTGGTGVLTANNTYSGITTVTAGTLQIGNGGATGTLGSGSVTNNAALVLNRDASSDLTVSAVISGSGTLTQAGVGKSILTGANTYTGATTVNAGTLSLGTTATTGTASQQYASSQYNIAVGATLDFNAPTGVTLNNRGTILTGAGTLTKTGAGTLKWDVINDTTFNMLAGSLIDVKEGTFIGSATYHGKWTNNLSSLNVASGASFQGSEGSTRVDALTGAGSVSFGWSTYGSLTVGLNNTAAGTYNTTAGTATFSGVLSGPAPLSKMGTGTQILTGTNTYSGATTISAGTLKVGNGGATGTLGSGAVTVTSPALLDINRTGNYSLSTVAAGGVSGTGNVTLAGTGAITLDRSIALTGSTSTLTATSTAAATNDSFVFGATTLSANTLTFSGTSRGKLNDSVTTTIGLAGGTANLNFTSSNYYGLYSVGNSATLNTIGTVNIIGTYTGTNSIYGGVGLGGTLANTGGQLTLTADASTSSGRVGFENGVTGSYSGNLKVSGNVAITGTAGSSSSFNGGLRDIGLSTINATGNSTLTLTGNKYGVVLGGAVTETATKVLNLNVTNSGTQGIVYNNAAAINITGALALSSVNNIYATGALSAAGGISVNAANTSAITGVISGTSSLTKTGAGTLVLTKDNTYSGGTTISASTLNVGTGVSYTNGLNAAVTLGSAGSTGSVGSGVVTLSSNANLSFVRSAATTIGNSISGTGNVSASITGASSTLTVSGGINLTSGTVNLAADSNLSVTAAIATTNTTSSAVVLNAGTSTAAGTSTGGNLLLSGSGTVTVGSGGRATLMTGSVSDSTGLTSLVGSGTGNFRYNSDETITNYTTALGAGLYAVYREASTLTATLNNVTKTYDGLAYSGGNGVGSLSGYVNGDASGQMGSITYGGSAQSAKNAGSYALTGTAASALGYAVNLTAGTLTVNAANLTLSGTRVYDGSKTFAGQYLTATGVNGETFALTGAGDATNLGTKNLQTGSALASVTGLILDSSGNGGISTNYSALSITGSSVSVTIKAASYSATATNVTYNGSLQNQAASTKTGFVNGDALTFTGEASGAHANTYTSNLQVSGADAGNYIITTTDANLVIGKANLTLAGTRVYDQGTTFAGTYLTATGVNSESFTVTGTGSNTNLSSKNVQTAQVLNSVTGLTLGVSNGTNAALSSNYNGLSVTASSVGVTAKSATVDATPTILTYNGLTQTQQAVTSSGFIAGDAITINGLASGKNASTYSSALAVSGADAGNYNVTRNDANLQITKATLTATGNSSSVTYNGASRSVSGYAITGLVGSDTVSDLTNNIVASGAAGQNAGSYTNTVTAGAQTNYTVSTVNGTLAIAKAPLTATGKSSSLTYNGFNQSVMADFDVTGLQGNDTKAGLSSITALGATGKNVGDYTNVVTAGTETNYTVTPVNGTLQIGKAGLIATGNSANVNYNGATQTVAGFTVSGLLGSDMESDLTSISASGASGKNVASYTNTVTAGTEANYTVSTVNGNLQIGKANLALSGSKVYNASTSFAGSALTATGVAGETFALTGSGDASNLASKDVQTGQLLSSLTGLTLGSSSNGGLSGNYNALSTTGSSVSVTRAAATVTGTLTNVTYNGAAQTQTAPTTSGFYGGDVITVSGLASGKNAGTYASNLAVGGAGASNYTVTYTNRDLVVAQAPLTVTATQVTKTYDASPGAAGTATVGVLAGAAAGDAVNNAGAQAFLNKDAGTNKTVRASGVTIKDASNADMTGNYSISYVDNITSVINMAPLTVTANNDARFVTQSDAALFNGVSYSGLVGGETSTVLGGALNIRRDNDGIDVAANTYPGVLVPSGLTSTNYNITFVNGNYRIVPANQLLIKTTNQTVVYGTVPTYSTTAQYVLDDGVNPSQLVNLSRTGSANNYAFSDGSGGSVTTVLKPYLNNTVAGTSGSTNTVVGTYDVKDANPSVIGGNFVGAPVFVGTLTVDTKPVTPSVSGVSKGYDGTTSMSNVLVGMTGKITGDSLSIGGAGAFTQKNVGTGLGYTISNIALSGGDAANYHLSGGATNFSGNDGAITAAPLVLTTTNVTKTYDRTTTATGTILATQGTQIFGSDSLAGGSFAFTNPNAGVGSKTVTVSGVTVNDGNGGANYTVTYANNTTSTINPKALGATYSALSKTYNGSLTASVSGGSGDIIGGDTVNFTNTSATFDTKNVGLGKTVTVSGIGISGADAGNYSLQSSSVTTTADITAKALTASFSGTSKAYDGGVVASVTGSSSDKLTGDVLTYATTSASFDNKNVGTNKQITVSGISLGGTDAGNYALQNTNATTTGAITRKDVTLGSITALGKTYDGTVAASITAGSITTGIAGEALSVSGSGTFDSKNAGSGKTVTVADVSTLSKVNGTGDWANYNLVTTGAKTTTASIAQAALTVTASAVSKTYDTTLSAGGSGVVSTLAGAGDVVSGIGSQTFLDKNAGTGKTLRALGVTIKDASNADTTGNYLITYVDNTGGVINKAPLEITANSVTKTYDGTVSATGAAVVRTGTVYAGDALSGGTFAFTDKNQGVGNKSVTISGVTVGDGVNTSNYAVTYANNTTSTINKAPLTVSATAVTKTYDGTLTATGAGTVGTLAGAGAGETVNVAGSLAFLDANAGTGKTVRASGVTIKDTGNADVTGNYNIAFVDNTSSVINKAALTASLLGPISKQYDGTTAATGLSNANFDVTGWANVGEGASVNLTTATYASPNVSSNGGTGALSTALLSSNFVATVGTNLGNYTLPSTASGNVGTITPAPLTVKVNNTAMFVTQDPNTAIDQGFAYTGLKNGETAVAVLGALSRDYTGASNPAAGNYVAVYDLTTMPTAANYSVTVQKGDLVVARADQLLLSIVTPSAPTTYGVLTSSTAGASATGVTAQYCLDATNCNGPNIANLTMSNLGAGRWKATDTANSTISFNTLVDTTAQTSAAGFVNAGNYAYGASSLTTTGTVNFNGSVVSGGVLTIDPKALTLNATNVTKVYDGTTALAGTDLTPTGTLSGDQVSVTSSGGTFAGKNVGSQNFSFSGLQLQGADRANYTFSTNSVTGTGSITPKTLTLSASASNKVYDGSATAIVGALSVSGAIAGDSVSATGGTASFSDKNVARNGSGIVMAKPVSISGVTLTGADAGNYQTDNAASATATITPLTVSASAVAQNKVYDGTTQAKVSGAVTGVLGSDAVSVTSTSSTFASKNVVRDAAGLPAQQTVNVAGLMLAGSDAGNYNLASATATSTATITPKALSASGAVANKVYDGSAQASLTGLDGSGLVSGDAVTVQASSAAFSDKNVARDASGNVIAKTVTVTGLRISGADANNYALMGSSFTAQASILPKSLNVVVTAQDKAYDGSAAATGSVSANNVVAGDALQLNWAPGNFASKDVSRNAQGQVQAQAVSFGSVQMVGADVGNYSLSSGTASTTATITPKTLQASGTVVADKLEDGNTGAQVTMGTLVGLVGSEQLTTTAEGDFDNASAGSNKPVQVQYRLLDGLNAGKANNYNLPTAIVNASITPLSKNNNAVKPNIVLFQSQSGKVLPLRVFIVKAQAAVGSADSDSKNDSSQACSSLNVEKCACEETAVRGVEICTSPVQNLSQETPSSDSALATNQQTQR